MTENPSIKEILISLGFSSITDAGKNYRCRPAYRDSSSASVFSIQKENGLWYDFKENIGGNIRDLVRLCLSLDEESAKKFLLDKKYQEISREEEPQEELFSIKKYPRECLASLEASYSYWNGRGISENSISEFLGGVAVSGKMYHRFVFPIFNETGEIIGFCGRDLIPKENTKRPKWKIIGPKNEFCYPYYFNKRYIELEKKIILVESIGDMLSLWDAGVRNVLVTFGLSLGGGILKTLIKSSPKEIIVALNNDSGGNCAGNNAAIEFRKTLRGYFDFDKVSIKFPTKKDFGEMTKEEIQLWKSQASNDYLHQE